MRNIALGLIALFTFTLTLSASTARANSFATDPMVINVPFAFSAGEKTLPAGKYIIGRLSTPGTCFVLRNVDGGKAVVVMAAGSLHTDRENAHARLVFNNYNGTRFLAQVWMPGQESGVAVSMSDDEEDLAESLERNDTVAVNAGR